jgi:hypothetical protein
MVSLAQTEGSSSGGRGSEDRPVSGIAEDTEEIPSTFTSVSVTPSSSRHEDRRGPPPSPTNAAGKKAEGDYTETGFVFRPGCGAPHSDTPEEALCLRRLN